MTVLRINLHIRVDVSQVLHAALVGMPPRPRAERLRKLAELGLQTENGQLHLLNGGSCGTSASVRLTPSSAIEPSAIATDEFGDDLANLLRIVPMVPSANSTK